MQRVQHLADPVELAGDGVRPLLDLALHVAVLTVEPEVPLGPAGVVLAIGAAMAGVCTQLGPHLLELRIVGVRDDVTVPAAGRRRALFAEHVGAAP